MSSALSGFRIHALGFSMATLLKPAQSSETRFRCPSTLSLAQRRFEHRIKLDQRNPALHLCLGEVNLAQKHSAHPPRSSGSRPARASMDCRVRSQLFAPAVRSPALAAADDNDVLSTLNIELRWSVIVRNCRRASQTCLSTALAFRHCGSFTPRCRDTAPNPPFAIFRAHRSLGPQPQRPDHKSNGSFAALGSSTRCSTCATPTNIGVRSSAAIGNVLMLVCGIVAKKNIPRRHDIEWENE